MNSKPWRHIIKIICLVTLLGVVIYTIQEDRKTIKEAQETVQVVKEKIKTEEGNNLGKLTDNEKEFFKFEKIKAKVEGNSDDYYIKLNKYVNTNKLNELLEEEDLKYKTLDRSYLIIGGLKWLGVVALFITIVLEIINLYKRKEVIK